jgi:hypothetical protein
MTNLNMDFEQADGVPKPELIEALLKMQRAIGPAKKTAKNPHFKTTYADLAAIWDVVRAPLHDNGFVLNHEVVKMGETLCLRSMLVHAAGCVSTHMPLMFRAGDMQSLMAAMTYAKRGNLGCLTGVVTEDEDDDGNNTQQAAGATKDKSAPAASMLPKPPSPSRAQFAAQVTPTFVQYAPPSGEPVQAGGKNADGSTKPHTIMPPQTTGEVTKFVDRLIDHIGERPISKVRASEWVAANHETLEKIKAKTPVLFKRFEEAYEGIRSSSQAID